jgi:hypothetical protein
MFLPLLRSPSPVIHPFRGELKKSRLLMPASRETSDWSRGRGFTRSARADAHAGFPFDAQISPAAEEVDGTAGRRGGDEERRGQDEGGG